MKKHLPILFFLLVIVNFSKAQTTCATAKRIWLNCVDSVASTINVASEVGPDYGCMLSQPNPNWYYFKAETNGTVAVQFWQKDQLNSPSDVDYICWGPFSNTNFCSNLTATNILGCSYDPSFVENLAITVTAGSYYVLVTTNYSNMNGRTFVGSNTGSAQIATFELNATDSICSSETAQLVASGAQSYVWNTGNTNDTIFVAPPFSSTYTVTGTHELGCAVSKSQFIEVGFQGIFGNISYSGGMLDQGLVHIFKYQPTFAGNDTVSSLAISPLGTYEEYSVVSGWYLIKADPDTTISAFASTIATYNGGYFRWDSASPIFHSCFLNDTINIQVLELPAQNGTATITGSITEGDGYAQRLMNPNSNPFLAPGGPLKGIDVKLGRNPGGGIQARAVSDIDGNYTFNNVPVGNYKVYVDIPNLPMDSTREITVATTTDSIQGNDYIADSVRIYVPTGSVSLEEKLKSDLVLFAYPNPFADVVNVVLRTNYSSQLNFILVDYSGRLVKSETKNVDKGNNSISIDTKKINLSAGVYFLKVQVGNDVNVIKLIKY